MIIFDVSETSRESSPILSRRRFLTTASGFGIAGASGLLLPQMSRMTLAADEKQPTWEETVEWILEKIQSESGSEFNGEGTDNRNTRYTNSRDYTEARIKDKVLSYSLEKNLKKVLTVADGRIETFARQSGNYEVPLHKLDGISYVDSLRDWNDGPAIYFANFNISGGERLILRSGTYEDSEYAYNKFGIRFTNKKERGELENVTKAAIAFKTWAMASRFCKALDRATYLAKQGEKREAF